jgi:hypothetical protein
MGVFSRVFANLAAESGPPDRVMIDSTHLKSNLTAASLLKKGDSPRLIGRTKGGLNSKLHAVCDGAGRPVIFLLTEGPMSDHKGAAPIYPMLPEAETLIADKGYDRDAFREALAGRHIYALHSTASQAPVAGNVPQHFVSTAPQGREHLRKAKRLAAYLNALRPLRLHILQRYLHRRNRYLLAWSMSPDPRS